MQNYGLYSHKKDFRRSLKMGRIVAGTLNLLRLRYKFIFCTRQTTFRVSLSTCLSWDYSPNGKTLFCVGSYPLFTQNKKHDNKSHRAFYGASNGTGLEKYCVKFAELLIHETELMEQVYKFLYA